METKKLSFKEKEQLLAYLGHMYRKGNMQKALYTHICIMEDSSSYANVEVSSKIQTILSYMEKPYAKIIENDFLNIKERGWWKELYSSSTYYRYKSKAMDTFLDCLYI
ncbi:MAG: hypothetical protein K2L08_04570 [Erysipelotrichaceae bacterium]|nr:hypothetical protein [Erysipelotrichaceae bacterium]